MGLKESGLRGSLRSTSSVLPGFFDVTITNTNSPVQEGDILTVDYSADNTGDAQDTQDIRLEIDSVEEDRDPDITLLGAQSTTGTLEWDTTNEDVATYTATVLSDDDTDSVTVEIKPFEIPDSEVSYFDDPAVIDDYEDDFDLWSGDTNWVTKPGGNFNGKYAEFEGTEDDDAIALHDVDDLPYVGDAFDVFVRGGGTSSFVRINTWFMVEDGVTEQDTDIPRCEVNVRPNDSPSFLLGSNFAGGDDPNEDTADLDLGATDWYRVEVRIFEDEILRAYIWPYDGEDPEEYDTDDALAELEVETDEPYPDEDDTGGFITGGASSDGEIWDIFRSVGEVSNS